MCIVSVKRRYVRNLLSFPGCFNQNKTYIRVYEQQSHILPIPNVVRSRHRQDMVGVHPIAANLVFKGVRPSGCFMVASIRLLTRCQVRVIISLHLESTKSSERAFVPLHEKYSLTGS